MVESIGHDQNSCPSTSCAWLSDCSAATPCVSRNRIGKCTKYEIVYNKKSDSNGRSRNLNSCDKCSGPCC